MLASWARPKTLVLQEPPGIFPVAASTNNSATVWSFEEVLPYIDLNPEMCSCTEIQGTFDLWKWNRPKEPGVPGMKEVDRCAHV